MKITKIENLIIFFIVFIVACAAGLYINLKLEFVFGDALVRSFHAYLVFFGNEPKLSSIGFVWPPLQTLLQLPLVLLKPLNTNGIAANVLSSLFFGIAVIYLNRIAIFFKVNKVIRYTVLLLFITNPLIFFYGINGMTEMIGISFILMALYYLLQHLSTKNIPPLIFTSLALSCAIMTRWEMGILFIISLFIISSIPFVNQNYSFREMDSSLIMFSFPVLFVIFIWLIISWLIMGSPIYFLHSTYSFTANDVKNISSDSVLGPTKGNFFLTFMFVFQRIIFLSLLFIPIIVISIFRLKNKTNRLYTLTILGFALSILLSQIMPIYLGKSYGQLRYFIYVIPICSILVLFHFKETLKLSIKRYSFLSLFLIFAITMIISSVLTFYAMSVYGNIEESALTAMLFNEKKYKNVDFEHDKMIAKYLSTNIHTRSILVDDSLGFDVEYSTQNPHIFIDTVDSDFKQTLMNPINSKASYLLITNPENTSGIDMVTTNFPKMFKNGADFVSLEKDFGNWRLYKINK